MPVLGQPISEMWEPLLSLLLMSAIVMGSPGPSTVSVTAIGAAFGLRRSLGYALGLVAGTTTVLLAIAAGLVGLLFAVPGLAPILIGASAAYMLYLAWLIATAPPLADKQAAGSPPSFLAGFLLAVANPKAYIAIAAVFAGATIVPENGTADAALKVAVLTLMIIVIHAAWLLAGASFARVLRDPVRSRIANVAFALALVASVLWPLLK
jgi:threonine/homoserine/homoserine lactone efflux protein